MVSAIQRANGQSGSKLSGGATLTNQAFSVAPRFCWGSVRRLSPLDALAATTLTRAELHNAYNLFTFGHAWFSRQLC